MNSKQYMNYVNTKETEWSIDEIEKLKLATNLYGHLNKERCEHLHLHVLPYKTAAEIQNKFYQLLREKENTYGEKLTSPKMKNLNINNNNHSNNHNNKPFNNTSPTLKSTVPLGNEERSQSPMYWANN